MLLERSVSPCDSSEINNREKLDVWVLIRLLLVILLIGMNVGNDTRIEKTSASKCACRAIETLLAQGSEVCFKMGAVVLSLGETIVNLTLVLEGRISIYRVSDNHKRQLMYFI